MERDKNGNLTIDSLIAARDWYETRSKEVIVNLPGISTHAYVFNMVAAGERVGLSAKEVNFAAYIVAIKNRQGLRHQPTHRRDAA